MKTLNTISIAAALALGLTGAAIAQDAGVDAGAGMGSGDGLAVDIDPNLNTGAGANVGVDTMTTGSISSQDNLTSSLQSTTSFDISAYTAQTDVNCISVSSLQGAAAGAGGAQTLDDAAAANSALATLRTDIEANSGLMSALEASCAVSDFDVGNIVFVQSDTDGSMTFYYDDQA